MNEVNAERDRATPRRRQDALIHSCMSDEEEDTCMSYEVNAERNHATPAQVDESLTPIPSIHRQNSQCVCVCVRVCVCVSVRV